MQLKNSKYDFPFTQRENDSPSELVDKSPGNLQAISSRFSSLSKHQTSLKYQNQQPEEERLNSQGYSFDSQVHYSKNAKNKNDSILEKNKRQWSKEKSEHLKEIKDHLYKKKFYNFPVHYTYLKKEPLSDKVLKEDTIIKSYDSQILFDEINKFYQSDGTSILHLSNSKFLTDSILKEKEEKQRDYKPVCRYFQKGRCKKGDSCWYYHPKRTNEAGSDNGRRFCNEKNLPIDPILKEIGDELDKSKKHFCLIHGEPESGKSTQIPQYLYKKIKFSKCKILCVQPTKVAAINLARKVAEELEVKLGNEVGYQLRHGKSYEGSDPEEIKRADNLFNEKTRLLFMPEEILLDKIVRECKDRNGKSSFFKSIKAILLDEIDERSLLSDLIFGMLKKTFLALYPHMKIYLISATTDFEKFQIYFEDCSIIKIPGRKFPVQIKYKPAFENNHFNGTIQLLKEIINEKTEETLNYQGHIHDILVFLVDFDEEMKKKIILVAGFAEKSITIDGVGIVIDSGLTKDSYYDHKKGIKVVKTFQINKISAQQRAGKAGRTTPGICYRLYSEDTFNKLKTHKIPKIAKVNLDFALLKIIECGLDPVKFPYFEPPEEQVIQDTLKTLNTLGALDKNNKLTTEGRFMVQMSTEPRKTKAIIQACQRDCLEEILIILELERNDRDIFSEPQNQEERRKFNENRIENGGPYQSDHLDFLEVYKLWEKTSNRMNSVSIKAWAKERYINIDTLYKVKNKVKKLAKEISRVKDNDIIELLKPRSNDTKILDPNYASRNILKCLTASYFHNLAKFSGFYLRFVNILDGFEFSYSNTEENRITNADGSDKLMIYSRMDKIKGLDFPRMVSFIPSSWLDDEKIIPDNLRNELKNGLEENYKYDQTNFELPLWAIRKFKNMFRDKIEEWTNKLEEIKGQNVKFISNDTMITFVHSKNIKENVVRFYNELKKELDIENLKETFYYHLENRNYTLTIQEGLAISEILLSNQYNTVFYRVLASKLSKEQVVSVLNLEAKDIDQIAIDNQGANTSGYIKFIEKKKAEEFIKKNQQKINEKVLEPVYPHSRNILVFDNYQIQVTFTLSKSKCVAHLLLGDESDSKVIFETLSKINHIIDGNNVSLEIDEKNPSLFIIRNLNSLTDEYILKNYFKDHIPNLQKVTVLREDPLCFNDEDKYKFESLFTKYLSPREIQNMCLISRESKNGYRIKAFVSLSNKNIVEEIVNDYDGKEDVFGSQRLRFKINITLKVSKEIFIVMKDSIYQQAQEIEKSNPKVKLLIDHVESKEEFPDDYIGRRETFYKIKIISKNYNLNKTIASQFNKLLEGEEFYGNKPEDKIKLFSIKMKEFCQKYIEWINKDEKIFDISWNNLTKKITLYSSLPSIIQESKNTIQKALDDEITIERIDRQNYKVKQIQGFLKTDFRNSLNEEEFKKIEFREIEEKLFIKDQKKIVELLKNLIQSFIIYNQTKPSEFCPICLKEMSDNFCLLYNCAHKFCKQCFAQYVESEADAETETSIISCPKCKEIVTLKDIKELLSSHVIDKIIDRHFQIYLKKYSNIYKNCSTPGCKYIYLIGTEPLKCEGCFKCCGDNENNIQKEGQVEIDQ